MASHVINPNTGRLISVTGDQYRKLVKLGVLSSMKSESGAQPAYPQKQETPRHQMASHQEHDSPDDEEHDSPDDEEPRQVQSPAPKQRSVKQSQKEIHQPIVNEYEFNDSDFDDD